MRVFSLVVSSYVMLSSLAAAQGGYDDYADYQEYQDYNGDYGQQDNLYHDYAERQQSKS